MKFFKCLLLLSTFCFSSYVLAEETVEPPVEETEVVVEEVVAPAEEAKEAVEEIIEEKAE